MQLMEARQICSIYYLLLTVGNTFLKTFRASVIPSIYAPERLCARVFVRPHVCAHSRLCHKRLCARTNCVSIQPCACSSVRLWTCAPVSPCTRAFVSPCMRLCSRMYSMCARGSVRSSFGAHVRSCVRQSAKDFCWFSLIYLICTSEIVVVNANLL